LKNIYLTFLIILFTFCVTSLIAQHKIKLSHVKGTSITRDKTPKEALILAVKEAQENALKKAGITESVLVARTLITDSKANTVNNFFNEISSIESKADILTEKVYPETRSFDKSGNMIVSVTIDATVFKYDTKKDINFYFKIGGLKEIYYENEPITFSFTPSKDGYLKIFVFNETETLKLYPFEDKTQYYLSDKKNKLFIKNKKVTFPINDAYKPGYAIELENKNKDESSIIIFVFTKNNTPFMENNLTRNTLLKWLYKIPIDQRDVLFRNILLKHNN